MSNKLGLFRRALRGCVGRVVAFQIRDGWGASLVPVFERVMRGERVHDNDLHAAMAMDEGDGESRQDLAEKLAAPMIIPAGKGGKATALVSCRGVAMYELEYQPYCFSTLLLAQTMNSLANDPEIGTIVLDIDSPGGVVTGTAEAGDAIFAARETKRVVALVNPLCASAAYWIASQASEIVAVPSADIGSIGVFLLHADCSAMMEREGIKPTFIFAGKYKTEGNSFEALGEEAKAYLQGEVDTIYAAFIKAVARGRGVTAAKVEADFGQGRTMMAGPAKAAGMIDRISTINAAMARWGISYATMQNRRRGQAAEDGAQAIQAPRYAKVGVTPGCERLRIIDEASGEEVRRVVECDCDEGWLVRLATGEDGQPFLEGDELKTERVEGRFRTEWPAAPADDVRPLTLRREALPGRIFVDGGWPQKTIISRELLGMGVCSESDESGVFKMTVANGEALYKIEGEENGVFTCVLQSSRLDPDQSQGDGVAGARRRRLELLKKS